MYKSMMGSLCLVFMMSVTVNAQWQSGRCGKRVKCRVAVAQPCPNTKYQVSHHSANDCQGRVVIRSAASSSCSTCPSSGVHYSHPAPALACRAVGVPSIPHITGSGNCSMNPNVASVQPACPCQIQVAGVIAGPSMAGSGTNSPFSLSGQQGPDTGNALLKPCERMFLACCAGGMPGCHSQYLSCAIALGEVVRHVACP